MTSLADAGGNDLPISELAGGSITIRSVTSPAVPEPATVSGALLASLTLLACSRRRR